MLKNKQVRVAPLASASFLIHSSQWKNPHGSLSPCTRKGHDAPTQHGSHPHKISPQPLVSPIQAWDLSSESSCSPFNRQGMVRCTLPYMSKAFLGVTPIPHSLTTISGIPPLPCMISMMALQPSKSPWCWPRATTPNR